MVSDYRETYVRNIDLNSQLEHNHVNDG